MTMIIPSRWFSGGMGLNSFREMMMNDRHITKMVDFANAKDCFPQNSISGGVCYFYGSATEQVIVNSPIYEMALKIQLLGH